MWFLEMESASGYDVVKTVEMMQTILKTQLTKQLEGLRGLTPVSEEILLWHNIACCRDIILEKQLVQLILRNCLILRNGHSHPTLRQPPL